MNAQHFLGTPHRRPRLAGPAAASLAAVFALVCLSQANLAAAENDGKAKSQKEKAQADKQHEPAFLGVVIEDVEEGKGAKVVHVPLGTPAGKAELYPGDVITAVGSKQVESPEHLSKLISQKKPGTKVKLTYQRGGETQKAKVKLTARPGIRKDMRPQEESAKKEGKAWLGILLSSDAEAGATIEWTHPGGPAKNSGLEAGDVILKVGKTEVEKPEDVVSAIEKRKPGEKVALAIRRDGEKQQITVELAGVEGFSRRFGPPAGRLFGDLPMQRRAAKPFPFPQDVQQKFEEIEQRLEELEKRLEEMGPSATEKPKHAKPKKHHKAPKPQNKAPKKRKEGQQAA
jgi:predicted metalloprotease with PDZ domain